MFPTFSQIFKNKKFQPFIPLIIYSILYIAIAYRNLYLPAGTAEISGLLAIKYSFIIYFGLAVSSLLFTFYPPQFRYSKIVAALFQFILGIEAMLYLLCGGQSATFFSYILPLYHISGIVLGAVLLLSLLNKETKKWQFIIIIWLLGLLAFLPILMIWR